MKTINWFKKELKQYSGNWNSEGERMLIDIATANDYNKEQCKDLIEDALWYNAEDICRLHCKTE